MSKRIDKVIQRLQRYAAAPGASYSDEKAQVIGCEFEAMCAEGIAVTPPAIVFRAADEDNPLHPFFTWEDRQAAQRWRFHEARNLMNHLLIVTQTREGETVQKATFSVIVTRETDEITSSNNLPEYVSLHRIQADDALFRQVEADAWREIRSWVQKYEVLGMKQFQPVFDFVAGRSK